MRPGARYALILGLLGAVTASALVEVDGATVLGHLRRGRLPPTARKWLARVSSQAEESWARSTSEEAPTPEPAPAPLKPAEPAAKKIAPARARISSEEKAILTSDMPKAVVRRTDMLREAVAKTSPREGVRAERGDSKGAPSKERGATSGRTHVDERITTSEKKALHDLLAPRK